MKNINSILEVSVDVLGPDVTSKIVGQLLLDLVNRSEPAEPALVSPAPEPSPIGALHDSTTFESAVAACSAKQVARRSKRPTRPQQSSGKRLKYKRFPKPKSLFDCKGDLRNGRALVARFRDGEIEYVIKGIEGSTAYVPDGYITSRGAKTEIDVKAAHHFWTVLGELPTDPSSDLPMVRGRAYIPQRPHVPALGELKVGSLLENRSTGELEFVKSVNGHRVTLEGADGGEHGLEAHQLQSKLTLVGHSPDFEEEVLARA